MDIPDVILGSLITYDAGGFSPRPPRFVQLFGASGSGKSTLVRNYIASIGGYVLDVHHAMQRQPVAQVAEKAVRPLLTIGHYNTACGGGDTLKNKDLPYRMAREAMTKGYDVLMEGIFLSLELHRVVALQNDRYDRHSIFLDVPMDECEESVQLRREAAGSPRRPLKQMADTHPRIMRTHDRQRDSQLPNLYVFSGDADKVRHDALCKLIELLE
jgi:predicted kinase